MKRFQSIGALLSAITGVLVAVLLAYFAVLTNGALDRKHEAAQTLSVITVMREMFSANSTINLEWGVVATALAAPEAATTRTVEDVVRLHARSKRELALAMQDVGAMPANKAASDAIRDRYADYDALFPKITALLTQPKQLRLQELSAKWPPTISGLSLAIDELCSSLINRVASTNPFVNEMMKVFRIAWNARLIAGGDRRQIANAIQAGKILTTVQVQQFAQISGSLNAKLVEIENDQGLPPLPTEMKAKIQDAKKSYFGDVSSRRQAYIDMLARGEKPSVRMQDWQSFSNRGLDGVMGISKTALDLALDYATEQLSATKQTLSYAIATMLLTIGLSSFTILYIRWRVVTPLKLITRTLRTVADGNLEYEISYKNRHDEIGQFADALQMFRNSSVEKQRLETELAQNQAAKDAAEKSSRLKSEFLANMSHELRTPLNAILGFSEIIGTEVFGPGVPRYRDYANDINGAGAHLLSLINDILDISKAEAGKLELRNEPVDLGELVKECARLMRGRAEEHDLRLALALEPLPPMLLDRLRVKQILLNLVSNAIKFSQAKGVVSVSAGLGAAGSIVVCVRDTGIGIAPEMIPMVFEPFRQIDSTLSRKFEGTGLGLSLVKTLIELHDGSVRMESALGRGTAVFITFPASRCLLPVAQSA